MTSKFLTKDFSLLLQQHIRSGNFLNYISGSFCIHLFYVLCHRHKILSLSQARRTCHVCTGRKLRNCITINSSTMQVAGTRKTKWFLSSLLLLPFICLSLVWKTVRSVHDESERGSRRIWWCLSDSCILRLYDIRMQEKKNIHTMEFVN